MKILYEKLLTEDIDAVKRQYSHIPEEEFDEIIKLDPTYKEGSNSVGKYGKWLLGLYKKDNPLEHDIEEIYGLLSLYNQYKNDRKKEIEKDINKFKSIADLYDAVNNVGEAELSVRQQERELRNAYKDAKLIFSDNKWEIWVPETYAASCTLGKGTEWCTADSRTDEYYNQYTNEGDLYVFINKQNPKEKYQLHIESKSLMDANDRPYDLNKLLSTDDKLSEFVATKIYGYLLDKSGAYIYNGSSRIPKTAKKVIISDGVTKISDKAFADYESLTSITIPDSVTYIGDSAFWMCSSLISIDIPDSVTYIGHGAFYGCGSLTSIDIPDSVTYIGNSAFSYCRSLISIIIPDSVIDMGTSTFYHCESLQSIILSNSITYIGFDVFSYCNYLHDIQIPDSVEVIYNYAFGDCKSLTSITIPDSVELIGYHVFDNCDNLKEVILENPDTEYEDNTFPEHTKIIKKGVNENMKIKTNESINLKRAKRLLENNGYIVTKKGLKESSNSKNFLCEFKGGLYEGEQFFVEAENYEEAVKIAHKVDSKVYVYKKTFTDSAVELSGLDVL